MCSFDLMSLLILYYTLVCRLAAPCGVFFHTCQYVSFFYYFTVAIKVHSKTSSSYKSYFSVEYELIFILYSAVLYNSFSRRSLWKPPAVLPALLFPFYSTSPISHPPFFPSAQGEDEALEFARICFPAAARALRWIEGICMGWGGESKRSEGEQERQREMLLLRL